MTELNTDKDRASYVRLGLNGSWPKDPNAGIPPWFCSIDQVHAGSDSRLVRGLFVHGMCFSDDLVLQDGRRTKVVACGESELLWKGHDLQITTSEHVGSVHKAEGPFRVLVRLYTPWLAKRDDSVVLPWRVLEEKEPGVFTETPARAFSMTGDSFGYRHDFPDPTGPKMHIACFGNVCWEGDRAFITA